MTVADLRVHQLPAQQAGIARLPLRRVSSERLTPDVADSSIWTPSACCTSCTILLY